MKEEFVQFIWRMRRFDHQNLATTDGQPVTILHPGVLNTDSGPDFQNARVQIADTQWAGNVEIHLKSSDWIRHKHTGDKAYDNVILHVVLDEDEILTTPAGRRIPCVELRDRIEPGLVNRYHKLMHNKLWIPCQGQLQTVPDSIRELWLDRLLVERLERKTDRMQLQLTANHGDLEETFFQILAYSLGAKVNGEPMERLARITPLKLLHRHKENLLQLEALLFGQAGLLEGLDDEEVYPGRLQNEYRFLRHKYSLTPMKAASWKFMRMRPANFPTVRIAQLATLIHRTEHRLSKVLTVTKHQEVQHMLDLQVSNYWQTHFRFGKTSIKQTKRLGKTAIELLVINAIAPFLFLYGRMHGQEIYEQRAIQLLEQVPAEKNSMIAKWSELGLPAKSAYQSQALIQLKETYCSLKRCLHCGIGNALLRDSGGEE